MNHKSIKSKGKYIPIIITIVLITTIIYGIHIGIKAFNYEYFQFNLLIRSALLICLPIYALIFFVKTHSYTILKDKMKVSSYWGLRRGEYNKEDIYGYYITDIKDDDGDVNTVMTIVTKELKYYRLYDSQFSSLASVYTLFGLKRKDLKWQKQYYDKLMSLQVGGIILLGVMLLSLLFISSTSKPDYSHFDKVVKTKLLSYDVSYNDDNDIYTIKMQSANWPEYDFSMKFNSKEEAHFNSFENHYNANKTFDICIPNAAYQTRLSMEKEPGFWEKHSAYNEIPAVFVSYGKNASLIGNISNHRNESATNTYRVLLILLNVGIVFLMVRWNKKRKMILEKINNRVLK